MVTLRARFARQPGTITAGTVYRCILVSKGCTAAIQLGLTSCEMTRAARAMDTRVMNNVFLLATARVGDPKARDFPNNTITAGCAAASF